MKHYTNAEISKILGISEEKLKYWLWNENADLEKIFSFSNRYSL